MTSGSGDMIPAVIGSRAVSVDTSACPRPEAAASVGHGRVYCLSGDVRCRYFVGIDTNGGTVMCAAAGSKNPQFVVRQLSKPDLAILERVVAEPWALGRWARARLAEVAINRVQISTQPEVEDGREFRLLETMIVPERVWLVTKAAFELEQAGLRAAGDPVKPQEILEMRNNSRRLPVEDR